MHYIWTTFFYQPLYNVLILLTNAIPFGDIGFAVIILTFLVKTVTYPLTKKAIQSQIALARLQPKIDALKKQYTDQKEIAQKTFELYKQEKTNPFSGCLVILVQFPVLIALYYVFMDGFGGTTELLYSFVHLPQQFNTMFLGLVDMTKPSIVLAVLAGVSQFIQLRVSLQNQPPRTEGGDPQQQLMQNMQKQMQYILPVLIIVIGVKFSGAVALYWITSNIIGAIQESIIRRQTLATMPQ